MTYDTASLHEELRAQNLRIHGCASTGRIDWVTAPTPQEQVTAQSVLAAHDPGKRERDERTARQALLDLADRMESGLATAQETRIGMAKLIRRTVR